MHWAINMIYTPSITCSNHLIKHTLTSYLIIKSSKLVILLNTVTSQLPVGDFVINFIKPKHIITPAGTQFFVWRDHLWFPSFCFIDLMLKSFLTEHKVSHFDRLVQERRNSTANALELRLSCTNPLISSTFSIQWLLITWRCKEAGGRLNKKDGLTRYGNSHVKDKTS